MRIRTWLFSLRGVKIYLSATAIISLSLFGSLFHSQPASAEGFLSKTLRCVVGTLLGSECQTPTQPNPTTPSQTTTPPQQPSGGSSSTPSPAPSQTQPSSPRQSSGTVPNQMEPLNVSLPEVPAAPEVAPTYTYPGSTQPTGMSSVLAANTYKRGSGTATAWAPLEPSREGWKILGIAWYWWAGGVVLIAAATLWMRSRLKQAISVAK